MKVPTTPLGTDSKGETMSVRQLIDEQASLFENPVVLLSVSPVIYQQRVLDTLKYFSERFGMGLYVTLNKPSSTLQGSFQRGGVPPEKVMYLDSITNTPEHETEYCRFLGRMRELTDLCIAITKLVSERKGVRFILLDSVSTLMIYNDTKSVTRFCHVISERLRSLGLPGAFVSVDMEEGRDMVAQLAQFCYAYVKAS